MGLGRARPEVVAVVLGRRQERLDDDDAMADVGLLGPEPGLAGGEAVQSERIGARLDRHARVALLGVDLLQPVLDAARASRVSMQPASGRASRGSRRRSAVTLP
jgi:hypothetical protein